MILTSFDQSLVTATGDNQSVESLEETQEFTLCAYIDHEIVLGPNERTVVSAGMYCNTSKKESLLLFPSEELLVAGGCLVQLIYPPIGELKVLIIHVGDKPERVVIHPGQVLGTLVAVQMP